MSFWCSSNEVSRKFKFRLMPAQGTQVSSFPPKSLENSIKPFSRLSLLLTSTLKISSQLADQQACITKWHPNSHVMLCLHSKPFLNCEEGLHRRNYVEDGNVRSCFSKSFSKGQTAASSTARHKRCTSFEWELSFCISHTHFILEIWVLPYPWF